MKRFNHKPIVNVGTVGHVDHGKYNRDTSYKEYGRKNGKTRLLAKVSSFLSSVVSKTARVADVFNNLLNRPVEKKEVEKIGFWWDRIVQPSLIRKTRRHGYREPVDPEVEINAAKKRHRKSRKRIADIRTCIMHNPCLPQSLKDLYFV